ncbi:MAG: asparagine synthase (glutamine-hydrolyzing) [Lachnospiraceae bacterium]|nr:asparagine synthase (glutamine-hydrolyzing) [Lachnospiraceae bacterium]
MCGISGFYNPYMNFLKDETYHRHILKTMNTTIKHRGPDDSDTFLSKDCGLSHVRLSIIDLISGHQPMVKYLDKTRTVAICYNGEIYNMHKLKSELTCDFNTESDTEVILNGYITEGIDYIKKLNGIFAFAIYDSKFGLYIVRDRLGVKPLFYTEKDNDIIFSSEIKGIFAYPLIKPVINTKSLQSVFGLGPAKKQGNGVFENIREVLPGHYLHIDKGGVEDIVYWQLISNHHEDSLEETIDKTAFLIEDSIKMQMLSDIPVCSFLSGGIDSSIISAICSKEALSKGCSLATYSFDFKENNIYFTSNNFQPSEDYPYVNIMKEHIKSKHTYLECSYDDLYELLFTAVKARDLPCMTDVESSLLYFCGLVSKNHKVALTGECADEIFGGYPWFYREDLLYADTFPWAIDLSPRTLLLKDEVKETLNIPEYVTRIYEQSISMTPILVGESLEDAKRREISYLNLTWFMTTLLDRMDRTSMYNGIEARVPFADHRIVEYLWNVPWNMKYLDNKEKGLLRAATKKLNILPDEVLYRKKSPYPKTYHPKYDELLITNFKEIINSPNEPINQLLDKNKALSFVDTKMNYSKPWYGQLMAGPQLIAYMLQVNYWMKLWT